MAGKAEIIGVVVSDKMDKSVVVAVERQVRARASTARRTRRTSKFMAHDEKERREGRRPRGDRREPPAEPRKRWVVTRVVVEPSEARG